MIRALCGWGKPWKRKAFGKGRYKPQTYFMKTNSICGVPREIAGRVRAETWSMNELPGNV